MMNRLILITTPLLVTTLLISSCTQKPTGDSESSKYYDVIASDTVPSSPLIAVTDEEVLQWGARVAYINSRDTIIPFGKYRYYGTDTLQYYANVLTEGDHPGEGRAIAINKDQKVLYDLMIFDNGPDPVVEGLVRILRNGKMGYANKYGQVVIPCIYDFADFFENGTARVTFKAIRRKDGEHTTVDSEEWFWIDKRGNKVKK